MMRMVRSLLKKSNRKEEKRPGRLINATDVNKKEPVAGMVHPAMKQFFISDSKEVAGVADSMIGIEKGQQGRCRLDMAIGRYAHTLVQRNSTGPGYVIHHLDDLFPLLNLTA